MCRVMKSHTLASVYASYKSSFDREFHTHGHDLVLTRCTRDRFCRADRARSLLRSSRQTWQSQNRWTNSSRKRPPAPWTCQGFPRKINYQLFSLLLVYIYCETEYVWALENPCIARPVKSSQACECQLKRRRLTNSTVLTNVNSETHVTLVTFSLCDYWALACYKNE